MEIRFRARLTQGCRECQKEAAAEKRREKQRRWREGQAELADRARARLDGE